MTRFRYVALAVVALALLAAGYVRSERRQVRRQLDGLAESASMGAGASDIERLARVARLAEFFTEDVIIRTSADNSVFVGGRRAVAAMATQASAERRMLKVSLDDVEIEVTDATTATAAMTVVISSNGPDVESVDLREVSVTLRKENGVWLIAQAQVLPARDRAP